MNTKMSAGLIHQGNKKLILNLIKRKGEISRSDIASRTGLTPPTIGRIIDELISGYNLVEVKGLGNSNGGRPPLIVKFKSDHNYIIGIDLGATYIRGCLVDLDLRFLSEIQIPTEIEKGFKYIIEKVVQIIKKFQNRPENGGKIWGVGIGVAGLVNRETGIIEYSPDFEWENINLQEEISKMIDIPVFYDNSTRLMALGELNFNKKSRLKNFAIINVGYGIAAGLVIDGNLIKGHSGFAGEFGHISIDTCSRIKCKCGKYGCLEALASGHRIANLGKNALNNKDAKILKNLSEGNVNLVSAELVAKAAKQGDEPSLKIYDEISEYLAQGIGTLTNLLNPEVVYIGGGISLNGEFFFDLINSKITKYLLPPNLGINIQPSTFGELATSIGAVSLVMEKIMNLELNY
jgi:glucokinase-like ROK family protein